MFPSANSPNAKLKANHALTPALRSLKHEIINLGHTVMIKHEKDNINIFLKTHLQHLQFSLKNYAFERNSSGRPVVRR